MLNKICYQGEPTECGLACFVMIANMQGVDITLSKVRKDIKVGAFGISMEQILLLAKMYEVSLEAIQFTSDDFDMLPTPAILHLNPGHFVVIDKIGRSCSVVLNPAMGRQVVDNDTLFRQMSGFALISSTDKKNTNYNDANNKIKLRNDTTLICLYLFSAITSMIFPILAFKSPEKILQGNDLDMGYFLIFICFTSLSILLSYMAGKREIKISGAACNREGKKIYNKLVLNEISFFERRNAVDIANRVWAFISAKGALSTIGSKIISSFVVLAVSLSVLLYLNIMLSMVVIVCSIISLAISEMARSKSQELQHITADKNDELERLLLESYQCVGEIKSSNTTSQFTNVFETKIIELSSFNLFKFKKMFVYSSADEIISTLEMIAILIVFFILISSGEAKVEDSFLFLFVRGLVTSSLSQLISYYISTGSITVALDRAMDVQDFEFQSSSVSCTENIQKIEVKELGYSQSMDLSCFEKKYPDISLHQGDCLLLKSPSGAGKTTLLKLISGDYTPSSGSVIINDKVADRIKLKELTYFHSAAQHFFSATILENITMLNEHVSERSVIEIIKYFELWDLICKQPGGLYSLVSEDINPFSAGEKQRILLCRAFITNKPVILLDEPTCNLDEDTARGVLDKIIKKRKVLIIATHSPIILNSGEKILEI